MKINFNKVVIVGGVLALTAMSAFAGYWDAWRVTVRSDNYHWKLIRVPTDRPIRLVKRLSRAECVYGRSWGITDRGIWVDNGCQAVFDVAGRRPGEWRVMWEDHRFDRDRDHEFHDWRDRDGHDHDRDRGGH